METWRDILRREHAGDEGSFLIQLRSGPGWDHDAFDQLFHAMHSCCKALSETDDIPRWIAELYWQLDWYVRQDIDRRWGDRDSVPEYYENAWTNLNHLAYWLFTGVPRADDEFEPMLYA